MQYSVLMGAVAHVKRKLKAGQSPANRKFWDDIWPGMGPREAAILMIALHRALDRQDIWSMEWDLLDWLEDEMEVPLP